MPPKKVRRKLSTVGLRGYYNNRRMLTTEVIRHTTHAYCIPDYESVVNPTFRLTHPPEG